MASLVPASECSGLLPCVPHAAQGFQAEFDSRSFGDRDDYRVCHLLPPRVGGYPRRNCFDGRCLLPCFHQCPQRDIRGFFLHCSRSFFGYALERRFGHAPKRPSALALGGALGCIAVSYDAHLPFCAAFATGVFILAVRKVSGESSNVSVTARNSSTIIYLVHMVFVVACVYGVFGWQGIWSPTADCQHIFLFAFVLACSIGVSAIVMPLSKRHQVVKRLFGI